MRKQATGYCPEHDWSAAQALRDAWGRGVLMCECGIAAKMVLLKRLGMHWCVRMQAQGRVRCCTHGSDHLGMHAHKHLRVHPHEHSVRFSPLL